MCACPCGEVFPNGNTYDGEWVNDMKEGVRSTLLAANRHALVTTMAGYGTLTYQNGEKYDGLWKADKVPAGSTQTQAQLRRSRLWT